MELETFKFHESRDVVFYETIFPFAVSTKTKAHCPVFRPVQPTGVIDDEVGQSFAQDMGQTTKVLQPADTSSIRPVDAEVPQHVRRSIR